LSSADYAELASRSGWSRTALRVSDAIALNGLIRRPLNQQAPWLLFFPGNDPTQLAGGQRFLESVRAGRDWGLAVFAYRGYDSSGGHPNPNDLASDGIKIVENLLESEQLKPAQLHVAAFSLGGYVAAYAVGRAAMTNRKLASLTLLSSVSEAEMVDSALLARITICDVYQTLPLLDTVPAPVLVLHGGADLTVDVSQGQSIAARLSNRAQFRIVPGAEHSLIENETAIAAVREMVESSNPR
jgi:pimeloyl-ACP methyl ester carboxylesterase